MVCQLFARFTRWHARLCTSLLASARTSRLLWVLQVVGSNPAAPTKNPRPVQRFVSRRLRRVRSLRGSDLGLAAELDDPVRGDAKEIRRGQRVAVHHLEHLARDATEPRV